MRILWGERVLRSVANLTPPRWRGIPGPGPPGAGEDRGADFRLEEANEALDHLRRGLIQGAAVLLVD